ncbi:Sortase family protein [compost metagenome]
MKNKIRNIVGVILILVGVIIIAWVGNEKYIAYKEQQKLKLAFDEVLNQSYEEGTSVTNESGSSEVTIPPMGLLKIPKINVETAVVEGVELSTLRYAIGHFPETSKAGEKGNFALAAHNDRFFKDVDELVKGDEIIIKTKENEYVYEVNDSFIVEPEQVSVLDATKDSTITLVTCTPGGKKRLIIKGVLKV